MPFVVLAQEILSIVATVRGPYDNVNVFATRRTAAVPEGYWGLMIEFDQDDRAVYTVVEDAVGFRPANPREVSLVQSGCGLPPSLL
jgi:hypothetical protein